MTETQDLKDSEVKELRKTGKDVPEFKAVIRTRQASVLHCSLGVFEGDNPVHTNNEDLIEGALLNGNLSVTVNRDLYIPRAERKEADEKASATKEASAKKAESGKTGEGKPADGPKA